MPNSLNACGLRLKAVGKRLTAKIATSNSPFPPLSAGSLLEGEIYPQ